MGCQIAKGGCQERNIESGWPTVPRERLQGPRTFSSWEKEVAAEKVNSPCQAWLGLALLQELGGQGKPILMAKRTVRNFKSF